MGRFTKLERPADAPPSTPGAAGVSGSPLAPASHAEIVGGVVPPRGLPMAAPPGQPGMGAPSSTAGDGDPRDYPSMLERADSHFFHGEYEKALRFYSRALQVEAARQYPWVGQLYALLMLNQVKEAELWASRALELFPEDS